MLESVVVAPVLTSFAGPLRRDLTMISRQPTACSLPIIQALRMMAPVTLEPFTRTKRIDTDAQEEALRARKRPSS